MVFIRMARPTKRAGSTKIQFRERVPADVLRIARGRKIMFALPAALTGDDAIQVQATVGDRVAISLKTSDKALAIARHAAAVAQFKKACEAFRIGPVGLTNKQHHALAGVLYHSLSEHLEDDPVSATFWSIVTEVCESILSGSRPSLTIETFPGEAQYQQLERYVGPFLDPILLREGVIPSADDRLPLLKAFAQALIDASKKLSRNAAGDYSPDCSANRFPAWEGVKPKTTPSPSNSLTFDSLLDRWQKEDNKSASAIRSFAKHVSDFKEHLQHNDARLVTRADVISWKDRLVERNLKAKTINAGYLASIRTLYRFAKRNDLTDNDPTEGIGVAAKQRAGTGRLPYEDAEVSAILMKADTETSPYLRWLPWLTALTGARVGEITQLWGSRVREVDGLAVIQIAPAEDDGSLKNAGSERDVPLHPAIVARGFLDFVSSRGKGPLFYGGRKSAPRPRKGMSAHHASKGVNNRLAKWIRAQGFKNPRKAPNHAFRHWFKTKCSELGVQDSVADAIQGHAAKGAAAGYRKIALTTMYEAICKLPAPPFKEPSQVSGTSEDGDAK